MINKIPKEKLFDFDESGIDLNINNEYGYIKKGVRLKIKRSGRRGKRNLWFSYLILSIFSEKWKNRQN